MRRITFLLGLAACSFAGPKTQPATLAVLSDSLETLAATVSPAVVQVQVSAWMTETAEGEASAVWAPGRVIGSGVIVDPSGYILTNEHVVRNARSVRVLLTPQPKRGLAGLAPLGQRVVLDAVVAGVHRGTDLALLKVEAEGLPAVSIHEKGAVRQGQLVVAVGSPAGLDNTVSLGIVSAVGRQPHPDAPMVYIQTDAAINPGNSGGPLLDVHGEVVGINAFIVSQTGGNQGLGFAVPAAVVRYVYRHLREFGAVRRSRIGIDVQTITPELARGLDLDRVYGIVIADILPGSPSDEAGLQAGDVVVEVNGISVSSVPGFAAMMYVHDPAEALEVTILRHGRRARFIVPVVVEDGSDAEDGFYDPGHNSLPQLGVFGRDVDRALAEGAGLRSRNGVYVVARHAGTDPAGLAVEPGDVIVSLNGTRVESVRRLQEIMIALTASDPAVFQIERRGRFFFVTLERQ